MGDAGNDTLSGGIGFDRLFGGVGNDSLLGGNGEDLFYFNTAFNATTNVDTIGDFEVLNDAIFIELSLVTGLTVGALNASDRIYYDTGTGSLYYDKDGSGSAAAIKFAVLSGLPEMTASSFFVYDGTA